MPPTGFRKPRWDRRGGLQSTGRRESLQPKLSSSAWTGIAATSPRSDRNCGYGRETPPFRPAGSLQPKFSSGAWTGIAATSPRSDRNCGYGRETPPFRSAGSLLPKFSSSVWTGFTAMCHAR